MVVVNDKNILGDVYVTNIYFMVHSFQMFVEGRIIQF